MTDATTHAIEKRLDAINEKLDSLDEAIRGNGKLGILIRLDRLEQSAQRQGKLIWLIVGAAVTGLASSLIHWAGG